MTLPVPLDQQIVALLSQQLRQIRTSNGYRTDAGQFVVDDETPEIPDGATYLEVMDDEEEAEFTLSHRRTGFLQIVVGITFPAGLHDASIRAHARKILADIRHALSRLRGFQFPGLIGIEFGGRSMFEREAGSQFFRPQQRLRVKFNETHLPKE